MMNNFLSGRIVGMCFWRMLHTQSQAPQCSEPIGLVQSQ